MLTDTKTRQEQIRHGLKIMDNDDGQYHTGAVIVWDALSSGDREVLNQLLHTGPVWDGNVISKSHRDNLLEYELAVRCCLMGEDGYTACSYKGLIVFKAGKAEPFKIKAPVRG